MVAGCRESSSNHTERLLSLLPLSHMLEATVGLYAVLLGRGRDVYPPGSAKHF